MARLLRAVSGVAASPLRPRLMSIMSHYNGRARPPAVAEPGKLAALPAQAGGISTVDSAALVAAPAPPPTTTESAGPIAVRLLKELEAHGELHDATLRTIEDAEEWQDYDADVSFELAALRHRYISTDAPMNSARRAQMQAHLRQKQREVMEAHATRAAAQFLDALTATEKAELRKRFLRLDAAGTPLSAAVPAGGGAAEVTPEAMKEALWEASESLAAAERRGAAPAGGGPVR